MESKTPRQYYLDWLRVIGIVVVFLFHCSMFFNSDDWHLKNPVSWFPADVFSFFAVEWMMPLFFFISGASTWLALQKKPAAQFMTDRAKRLLIPLALGIFILAPHQVYFERLSHGQFKGSFVAFLPHYFDGWYGLGGNFAWMGLHCWYLLWLFVFSCIALPLFLWIKRRRTAGKQTIPVWTCFLIAPFLLALPAWVLSPEGLLAGRMWGGWSIFEHLLLFLMGYYAFSRQAVVDCIPKYRYVLLTVTLLLTAANFYLAIHKIFFEYGTAGYFAKTTLRAAVCLFWIGTLIGFAEKRLNYTNGLLRYTNEAVLPFYVLHQPVILLVGFSILQWQVQPGLKYGVLAVGSFVLIAILYVFVVKRSRLAQKSLGMS